MVVLDTDHISLLDRGGEASARLAARLRELAAGEVVTTITTFEEQMRGWLAYVARASSIVKLVDAYHWLHESLDNYRTMPVLDFDDVAATQFQRLRSMRLRVKTMDLRIAAVTLAHSAILLSRNLGDFRKVPGLRVENWAD